MVPFSNLLDARFISPGTLATLGESEAFIPIQNECEIFLLGSLGSHEMLICLGGERPFHHGARSSWFRQDGYRIKDLVFEVDLASAVEARSITERAGTLVLSEDGMGIVGTWQHRKEITWVRGNHVGQQHFVGFNRWTIGVGDPTSRVPIYSKSE